MMCVHIVGIVAFSFYTPFNARKQDDAYGHAWGLKIRRLNRSRFQNPGRQGKSGAVTEGQKEQRLTDPLDSGCDASQWTDAQSRPETEPAVKLGFTLSMWLLLLCL